MKTRVFIAFIIIICLSGPIFASALEPEVDPSRTSRGIVGARYQSAENKRLKVIVNKGETNYYYSLNNNYIFDYYPLQLGNGAYQVSVMENVVDAKYRFVSTTDLNVNVMNPNSIYLASMKLIDWNMNTSVVRRAVDLTKDLKSDELKIRAIYNYVVKVYSYDYDKLNNIPEDYFPVLNTLVNSKKGICYDYSAIMAAMLRSVGIPSKLIMGYTSNINGYHAWNEIYLKNQDRWIVVDTTYDAVMDRSGSAYSMEKNRTEYSSISYYY
jgi:transglutaminase-like putative cysteine protease